MNMTIKQRYFGVPPFLDVRLAKLMHIQLTPDNSNLQGKSKKVRVNEGKIRNKIT